MCAFGEEEEEEGGGCRMKGWEVVVGGHPIITNQNETGGSCHRNLVHGSPGPSHHTRRIAYHIMIIISFLRQKGKKGRREGGREGDYRP